MQGEADNVFLNIISDKAEAARRDAGVKLTDFLDPHQQALAQAIVERTPGAKIRFDGGYARAERKRAAIMPDFYLTETTDFSLAAVEIKPIERGGGAGVLSHRDFLGAILGLGVKREKIGDLIVLRDRCQAILAREIQEFVLLNLQRVGNAGAEARPIDLDQLEVPAEVVKEIRGTVASMRLDAIASLGFGVSRSKMAEDIKAERVRVNWVTTTSPGRQIKQGDVISIRGRGRVEIKEVLGETKRGRISVVLNRYI
ncbi:MAG TPA: photosystem II S4 domain protein [Firmicutes bacterium]|nr:photosystem II S4 domain protein [Bacillota bacterium]